MLNELEPVEYELDMIMMLEVGKSAEKNIEKLPLSPPEVTINILVLNVDLDPIHRKEEVEIHILPSALVCPNLIDIDESCIENPAPKIVILAVPLEGTLFHLVLQRNP